MMDDKTYKPRFWKTSEVKWLKENITKLSYAELAEHLGRSEQSVKTFCHKIKMKKKPNDWTEEEDMVLMAAYPYVSNPVIAKALGKNTNKVARRGAILSLEKVSGGKSSIKDYYRALLYKDIEDMYDALTREEQMEMCIALINRLTYGNKTRTGLEA